MVVLIHQELPLRALVFVPANCTPPLTDREARLTGARRGLHVLASELPKEEVIQLVGRYVRTSPCQSSPNTEPFADLLCSIYS